MKAIDPRIDRGKVPMAFQRDKAVIALVSLSLAGTVLAQQQNPRRPEDGGRPPRPQIETALDANNDGNIDAAEIANAPAALLKLDKNGDGKLSPDEYRPPHPEVPVPDSGPATTPQPQGRLR
jgi:hypothetical protein